MNEEKILDMISRIIMELDARNSCCNCVDAGLLSYGWDDLCNKGSELFQQLKEN